MLSCISISPGLRDFSPRHFLPAHDWTRDAWVDTAVVIAWVEMALSGNFARKTIFFFSRIQLWCRFVERLRHCKRNSFKFLLISSNFHKLDVKLSIFMIAK